ncbi:hypothetical protein [Trujillonella endophytica]|uniref:Uncharacterized protein n=1 Tax=Trujillonella endophytica TaxID=673521 RepID=A0A1H8Q3B2_9ACTN|nr:hypothetical protein [Trujillella endophytica]SEO48712.1 hypothetical protein SAMN05660991_00546 [Trujillella endophytica]
MFGAKNTAVVDLARSAYHVVAQGLGCAGVVVTRVEEIAIPYYENIPLRRSNR